MPLAVSGLLLALLAAAATAGPAAAGGAPSVALPLPAAGPLPAGLAALGLGAVAPGLSGLSPAPLRPATVPDGGAPSAADALAWLAAAKSSSSSAADSPSGPRPSGLSWRSGASCSASGFAGWRGRAMDVHVGFTEHDTWDRMLKHFRGGYFRGFVRRTPQVVVSLPMMPRSAKRQHAACARGQFDATFRQIGALLVQAGAGNAIIRLGWEANIGSDSHPWGIDGTRDIPDYKRCFQREVAALKATAPNLKIEWTNAKRGSMSVSTLESYPGDQSVDLMGIHYYNNTPKIVTDRDWEAMYKATHNKGPWGLGEWLKAAKARGRKLGIGE
jgi:hypothetical protein